MIIKTTKQQDVSIEYLAGYWPDHDAWIDFATTDDEGTVWVLFQHGIVGDHHYQIMPDGTWYGDDPDEVQA